MALSVGEIEATLRARDEFSSVLSKFTTQTGEAATALNGPSGLSTASQTAAGFMEGLAVAVAGLVTVGGLSTLARHAIEFGSALDDLHAKTGLSVEELQRLKYAGDQTGVSMEEAARGIQQLQRRLVEEQGGAVKAVEQLGLNLQTLKASSPDEMFEAIASAIQKVPDPAERTALAMELLGRSGANLLPLLLSNIDELTANMPKLSESQVKALDAADDAWARWKDNVLITTGQTLTAFASLKDAANTFGEAITGIRWGDFLDSSDKASGHAKDFGHDVDLLITEVKAMDPPLTDAERALQKYNDEVQRDADILTGRNLVAETKKWTDEIQRAGGVSQITDFQVDKLTTELMHLQVQGATLNPTLLAVIQRHIELHGVLPVVVIDVNTLVQSFANYRTTLDNIPPAIGTMVDRSREAMNDLLRIGGVNIDQLKGKWDEYRDKLHEQELAHQHMVATIQGTLVTLFDGMLHGWDGFKEALKNIFDQILKYWEEKIAAKIATSIADWLIGAVGGAGGGGGGGFWGTLIGLIGGGGGGGGGGGLAPTVPGPPGQEAPPGFVGPLPPEPEQPVPPGFAPPFFGPPPGSSLPKPLAAGGLISSPTLALLGERGPEYVIPAGRMAGGGMVSVTLELDGWTMARALAPYIPGEAKRYSLTRQ